MRILYDHQIFSLQKFGGISRYFAMLISSEKSRASARLGLLFTDNEHLRADPHFSSLPRMPQSWESSKPTLAKKVLRRAARMVKLDKVLIRKPILENQSHCRKMLEEGEFDIFHPTYYDDYFLQNLGSKKLVITVYDMIHEIFPELFSLSVTTPKTKGKLIQRADRIIAISESTKADLLAYYPEAKDKVDVIHLGPTYSRQALPWKGRQSGLHLPTRYLLFTGLRGGYKNFLWFLRALAPILRADKTLHLLCTGEPFSDLEKDHFQSFGVGDQVHQRHCQEADLFEVYASAIAFVFPSLYEGFGFPVLEAFAAGCPVVMSRTPALTEIGDNAALFFDPKDCVELTNQLKQVLENNEIRNDLVQRGYERLKAFSWDETVSKTVETYKRVLSAGEN